LTAREAAYQVVLRVFEDDAYADRVLRSAAAKLDARDRALAQRLAFGTVQRVRTLDHAIETLGKRPVRKLDPPVRAALRLGAYQLGYSDTAAHAAVNESVELVRRARLERAVPFTNAVMRRLSDGIGPLLESLPDGPLKEYLQYSTEQLVSTDINQSPYSCIFDSGLTMAGGRIAKVFGWYDNEWGYSCRLVDLTSIVAKSI